MTTTPANSTGTAELLAKVEQSLSTFQEVKGEVVGEKQLDQERAERKFSVLVAVAVMSLISLVAVITTVALLRHSGPPSPVPIKAQFISSDLGCLYRVTYRAQSGTIFDVDAKAPMGACGG